MITFKVDVSGTDFTDLAATLEPELHTVVAQTVAVIDATMGELIVAQNAVDTGAMLNSRGHEMTGATKGEAWIGQEYAPMVNYGTVRMPARSFFEPAVDKGEQVLNSGVDKVLGG